MDHDRTRNIEGWYWLGLCASVLLGATLWACWPLLSAAGAGAEVAAPPRTDAPPPAARTPEPWYVVKYATGRCTLAEASDQPIRMMENMRLLMVPYTIKDVTEHGVVVQTTLVLQDQDSSLALGFVYYRGRERCERGQQAEKDEQRLRQQARDEQLKKYR